VQVFVLGAPRSGTTVVGNFIASHPLCLDLGEYYAYYLAYSQAPQLMQRIPSPVKDEYLDSLATSGKAFAERKLKESKKRFWCDQTPWNLCVSRRVAELFPKALFVLMLRDFRGTVLSLRDSYAQGYQWAGSHISDSAQLWASFYEAAQHLPSDRTFAVSYDRLCRSPQESIASLEHAVGSYLRIGRDAFDRAVFADSHAKSLGPRRTLATKVGDKITFTSIEPYDSSRWNDAMESQCIPYVENVERKLKSLYGVEYVSSSAIETVGA
jgi:hypothetical protein